MSHPVDNGPCEAAEESLSDLVTRICQHYGEGCRLFTGEEFPSTGDERRRHFRERIEIPLYLYALTATEKGYRLLSRVPLIAVSRDISPQGIGWRCDSPLPSQVLVVELDIVGRGCVRLLVETRWQRKKSRHSFVAGGLFLGRAEGIVDFDGEHTS